MAQRKKVNGGEKTKKQKTAPLKIVGIVVLGVLAVGVAAGWVLRSPGAAVSEDVASLQRDLDTLQENHNQLLGDYDTLNSNYSTLNTTYNALSQNYASLQAAAGPNFPSGVTYNQFITWDYLRVYLCNMHIYIGNDYWDDILNLAEYKIGHTYIRDLMRNLIGDIEAIRENASADWKASIDKIIEAAEWNIKGFENYALYVETELDSYYNLNTTCYNNAGKAQTDAWELMPAG